MHISHLAYLISVPYLFRGHLGHTYNCNGKYAIYTLGRPIEAKKVLRKRGRSTKKDHFLHQPCRLYLQQHAILPKAPKIYKEIYTFPFEHIAGENVYMHACTHWWMWSRTPHTGGCNCWVELAKHVSCHGNDKPSYIGCNMVHFCPIFGVANIRAHSAQQFAEHHCQGCQCSKTNLAKYRHVEFGGWGLQAWHVCCNLGRYFHHTEFHDCNIVTRSSRKMVHVDWRQVFARTWMQIVYTPCMTCKLDLETDMAWLIWQKN